jgi:hypothetical protein
MKRSICIIAVLLTAVMLLAACASSGTKTKTTTTTTTTTVVTTTTGRNVPSRFPDFVKNAIKNAPEDALVGIGMANLASASQSMTISATRARAEISRQMNTMIQDMVRDYQASSEVDRNSAISFQENITVALSKSSLSGSRIVDADFDDGGNCWTVVQFGKSNIVQEINQAQAAAKLAVPAMASFNAEERMNAAMDKAFGQEVQVGDR